MASLSPGVHRASPRWTCLAAFLLAGLLHGSSISPAQAPTASARIADPANLAGERVSPPDLADTLPINHGAAALQQLLRKLRTRASLMMIVAHPDDEDGGMLTYESRGQGARVATLTLTRGEGGQNLMSADFNDALGLIRTQELLAADRYFGVDQFFGTEVDFGFSKTKEETFQQWTHDRVLYDAVRCVRLYRPLVLASVFVGGPTDGHGHHQVSGEITQEVFLAAADPKVFPEMGLTPWAPLKVYARVPFSRVTPQGMYDYATGKTIPTRFHNYVTGKDITTEPQPTVLIHEGEPSTALAMEGRSYVQFAREGLALQKSQIGSGVRLAAPGVFDVGYTLMGSRLPRLPAQPDTEISFFDGIDVSLPGIASLAPDAPPSLRSTLAAIDAKAAEAGRLFDPAHLDRTAAPLRDALLLLDPLVKQAAANIRDANLYHELKVKRVQFNDALLLALGVEFRAASTVPAMLTTDTSVEFTETFTNHGVLPVRIAGSGGTGAFTFPLFTREESLGSPNLPPGSSTLNRFKLHPLSDQHPTRPYFSRKSLEQPFYDVADEELRNAPATTPPLVSFGFVDDGVELDLAATVQAAPDPQHADQPPHPLVAIPPVSLAPDPSLALLTPAKRQVGGIIDIESHVPSEPISGQLHLAQPAGWTLTSPHPAWTVSPGGKPVFVPFTLAAPPHPNHPYVSLDAIARMGKREYAESFRTVGYAGLTPTNFYVPAAFRAVALDVQTAPNLHIAYLPGTGDTVPAFLLNLGITPTLITPTTLTPTALASFDAVLLGVRAYAAHAELADSSALLDYAKAGGVVIVQYNTARYGNAQSPYPISVPGDPAHNVVVEAQPVTVLTPAHPLLNWPNKITAADFSGWTEELGHGFAASWDPHFEALTETHDPGQDPQRGGLLYARTGRGAYIYCAYALYRQLPEGVPGAYRLLANLLSLSRNPAAELQSSRP